jgi:hypothetical protein
VTDQNLTFRVRLVGGREVEVQNAKVAASFKEVGHAEAFAAEKAFLLGESEYSLKRWSFWAITSLGLTTAELVKLGFEFDNAKQEGIEALEAITGSARTARSEVAQLIRITHTSGLGLGFLVGETKNMLQFGYSVRDTNAYLRAFSNFAGKNNLGEGGVRTLVGLFDRVHDNGFLTSRDIKALQGLGIPANRALGGALGLTPSQMYLLTHGQLQISAGAALPALAGYINRSANRSPYGLGQLFSILKGDLSQELGGAESPLFGAVRRELTAAVTGYARGGARGALTGVDPSGSLLAFVLGVKNAGIVVEHALSAIWNVSRPLVFVFGAAAKTLAAVTGNLTVMKAVLEPLIGLYILDRARSLFRISRDRILGVTAESTATNVGRLGIAAGSAATSLERVALAGGFSKSFPGGAAAGGVTEAAEVGFFARMLGGKARGLRFLRGIGGLGEGAALMAGLNLASDGRPLSKYDSWSLGSLEHGFGLFQGSTWKNALAEMGVPGVGYTAVTPHQQSKAIHDAIREGMAGVKLHGTLQTPDQQRLADVVFQGKQSAEARR